MAQKESVEELALLMRFLLSKNIREVFDFIFRVINCLGYFKNWKGLLVILFKISSIRFSKMEPQAEVPDDRPIFSQI